MSFPKYAKYKESDVAWLGQVPAHWGIGQSRRLFAQRKERAHPTDAQLTASQKHGVIYQRDFMELEGQKVVQVIHGADILKHVEPNDFVISMRSFQGGIEWCGVRGCISSAYVMLVPCDKIEADFFRYLLKSSTYIQALQSTSNLVRDGQALRYENFSLVDLPLVPKEEQRAIANFLDHETAKIDALVAEQQRLIELLKEKRQAVISQAVTKGLDPNVPMKDSGVEWLGKVPAHWQVQDLKYLASRISSGKTPLGGSETYVDDGVMLLRSQNVYDEGLRLDDVAFITEDTDEQMASSRVQAGDILLNITGASIGRTCLVPDVFARANVNQHVCVVRMRSREVAKFVAWSLKAPLAKSYMSFIQNGAARDGLTFEQIGNLSIAVPPASEQQAIAQNIAEVTEGIDDLILEVTSGVALLQERRSALISAAVTGKIDVRGLVRQTEAVAA